MLAAPKNPPPPGAGLATLGVIPGAPRLTLIFGAALVGDFCPNAAAPPGGFENKLVCPACPAGLPKRPPPLPAAAPKPPPPPPGGRPGFAGWPNKDGFYYDIEEC